MRSDLIHLLTEFEIGVPNVSAAVDDKLFLGVSWTFLNHWTRLTHCRFLLGMTSRVSIYRMCCKCYKCSALAVVDGNSTFLYFTLKVARRNGINCNKQFSMVIIRIGSTANGRRTIFAENCSSYRDGSDHFCACHLGAVFGTTPAGSAARRRPAIAGQCGRARGSFTSWFLCFKAINEKCAPTTWFTRLRGTIWAQL